MERVTNNTLPYKNTRGIPTNNVYVYYCMTRFIKFASCLTAKYYQYNKNNYTL